MNVESSAAAAGGGMNVASSEVASGAGNGASPVGWLVFDNPARLNAMSLEMWREAVQTLDRHAQDPALRALVMRGAGERAFIAGADVSQFDTQRNSAEASARYSEVSDRARAAMSGFPKPLIAMIRGYCFGAGVDVALRADVRIAADDAVFCIPAAKLGLAYGFDSVRLLVSLVGPAVAKDMLFSGRRLDAGEALRVGLVNHVVAADELEAYVGRYAADVAANAPLSIRAAKLSVGEVMRDARERDLEAVSQAIAACFDSRDYAEGRKAFKEKRKPLFTGA